MNVRDTWRLSLGTFTIVPTKPPRHVDSNIAANALLLSPALGFIIGGVAAGVVFITRSLTPPITGDLLGAALGIATIIWLTRALHVDGLADTADALGSGRPSADALAIARKSDIGPFGVVTIVVVVSIDITAVAASAQAHHASLALITAVVTGRLAVVWAAIRGVPSARRDGLGFVFAGSVSVWAAVLVTLVCAFGLLLLGWFLGIVDDDPLTVRLMIGSGIAVLAGLGAAWWIVRRSIRRLGGVTGDVFGACVEVATMTSLVVMAGATFAS
jgi:adenosylcobinamide-GDP ribazoletransferase